MIQKLLLRRLPLALAGGILLVAGTLSGTAAYEASHPTYDRVVWIDRSGADPQAVEVVRRTLFADDRFLALTATGYRGGILDPAIGSAVFATISANAPDWAAEYRSPALLDELIDIRFEGASTRTIRIWNPGTNMTLPRSLAKVLLILSAGDRNVAKVPFAPAGLLFRAAQVADSNGAATESVPVGFPLAAANQPTGIAISGSALSQLHLLWPDLFNRLAPGLNQRFVEVGDQLWRITWTLDLGSVGGKSQLSTSGANP